MLVYSLTGLLAVAVLFVPISQSIKLPYTVILAALGLAMGAIGMAFPLDGNGPIENWFKGATSLTLSSELILFLFLPLLVFEAALSLNARRLIQDLGVILLLAIVGLVISTFIVGVAVSTTTGVGLMTCLLLGAICSATDPVAVVGVFKDVGAPKRLATLVEGESLFNDATALVLFVIISGLMVDNAPLELLPATLQFLKVFTGGILVGLITAYVFCRVISSVKNSPLVNHALSVAMAYFAFIFAEHYLHVSGVMAVVSAGLFFGATTDRILNHVEIHTLHEGWEQLGFWANSIIFVIMGIVIAKFLPDLDWGTITALLVLIISANIARAGVIFGLLGVFERFRLVEPVSNAYKAVMTWGGLRGAVSLALALMVLESSDFGDAEKSFIVVLVSLFVLTTLFVNATTIGWLIRWLRLDQLSPVDEALKRNALAEIYQAGQGIGKGQLTEGLSSTEMQGGEEVEPKPSEVKVTPEEWEELGLAMFMGLERRHYKQLLDQGAIDGQLFSELVNFIEDALDTVKLRGTSGLVMLLEEELTFSWDFKAAVLLHRRFKLLTPLKNRIGRRFESLSAKQSALNQILAMSAPVLLRATSDERVEAVKKILRGRRELIGQQLKALAAQFPTYFDALEKRRLNLDAVNQELDALNRLSQSLMVPKDVSDQLQADLSKKRVTASKMPVLDITLDTRSLLLKVPLLKTLSSDQLIGLTNKLTASVFLPGELVCQAGDPGDAMYFIVSGAMEVDLGEEAVVLGSGEFFGELALIKEQPRNASVKAVGFCELLKLNRSDFDTFITLHPSVRDEVMRAAEARA